MPLLDDAQQLALLDLIEAESRDFTFRGWERILDNVRCFRVVGLDHVLDHVGLTHANIYGIKAYENEAKAHVPESWKEEYPSNDWGWKWLKRDQFSYAYNSLPMRLDKACTAILVACAALDAAHISFTKFFDYVQIRPQLYFVDGYTEEFYNGFVRNTEKVTGELLNQTGQVTADRLGLVAQGRCVTKRTATKIYETLNPQFSIVRGVVRDVRAPKTLVEEAIVYNPAELKLPILQKGAGASRSGRPPE